MLEQVLKRISYLCASISIIMGSFFIFWWHFSEGAEPAVIGISYPGSICFIFIGLGLFSLFSTSRFPWTFLCGAVIASVSFYKMMQQFFFPSLTFHFTNISQHANPLNIIGFFLIGTLYLSWKRERMSQIQFFYAFFVAFTTGGFASLALLAYIFGFAALYDNTHLFGMITLIFADIGLLSAVVNFEITLRANRYRWVPVTIGFTLVILALVLSFGLYLYEEYGQSPGLLQLLTAYGLIGGFIFAVLGATLAYFWLLSTTQLQKVKEAENSLKFVQEREQSALLAAEVGIWRWEIQSDQMYWDETSHRLFGLPLETLKGNLQNLLNRIHPLDREELKAAIDQTIARRGQFEAEVRMIWPDGSLRHLLIKGNLYADEMQQPLYMTGIVSDITARKYSEQLLSFSEGISKILGTARSLNDAAQQILSLFHNYFGWQILVILKRNALHEPFSCVALESKLSPPPSQFLETTQTVHASGSDPLFESLAIDLLPIAVKDFGKETKYIRSPLAAKEGIRGGLAFPIVEGNFISGIVELFKEEPFQSKIDPSLANLLNSIGIGIGEFIRRKTAESAEHELTRIISASRAPIYSLSMEGTILSWNEGAEATFGWKSEEILGKSIQILFLKSQLEEFDKLKQMFQEGRDFFRLNCQRLTKTGKILWVENTYSIFKEETGKKSKIAVVVRDITEEKTARDLFLKTEEKYRTFVETTDEWIWEMDAKGVFTYSNPAVEEILGYKPEEIVGQSVDRFFPIEKQTEILNELKSAVSQKKGWTRRSLNWKDRQNKERILESTALPVFNEQNQVIGFRGADRDITERRMIEKMKNQFISMVSHEIRTPLTSIHGALGLLANDPSLSSKAKQLIELAYRNSKLLSTLIQDTVDIERIESGKIDFHLETIQLSSLIHETIRSADLILGNGHIQIVEETILPDIMVKVDGERLTQVLLNLLSNAIKFSPQNGRVFVSMQLLGDKVRVSVRDEGAGVPEEFQKKIFGRFEQAAIQMSAQQKGTGLGLSISKMIIERLGGTIGFDSKPGEGSTFYFDLPILKKKEAA